MSSEEAGPLHALPLFTDVNVLPLNFLYYQTISNLMHLHNSKVPSGILNLFQKTSSCHFYNTRASAPGNFYVNSSDVELYKLSFSRSEANLWNEIPCHIRHLPKNKFKKTLRKTLFDILNSEDNYINTPALIKKVKMSKTKFLLISFYFYNVFV